MMLSISRAAQALDIKVWRASQAHLDPRGPLVLQDLQTSIQSAVTAQLFQEFPDPEDHLEHQAHRGLQELMESQLVDWKLFAY